MNGVNGPYSSAKSVQKGVLHGVLSVLPALAGVLAVALQSPDVVAALQHAWPALPAAALVGGAVAILNWLKNR